MPENYLDNKKLVIIIPAFNEEKKIVEVIKNIPEKFSGIAEKIVLVIDDGSTDKTAELVKKETAALIIRHEKNKGVGAAMRTGINHALKLKADLVVNIDADGQFDSRDIEKLINPILEKRAEYVIASRFFDKGLLPANMPKVKIWGNKIMAKIISFLTKNKFYDVSCGFRAYSREAILRLNLFGDFTYTQEVLIDLSFKELKILEIPVRVKYFKERSSRVASNLLGYTLKSLRIILQIIIDYKPLSFFGSLGFGFMTVGFLMDLVLLVYFILFGHFTPYKFWGILGGFLIILGILFVAIALLANMVKRVRIIQENILYYEKKKNYYKNIR